MYRPVFLVDFVLRNAITTAITMAIRTLSLHFFSFCVYFNYSSSSSVIVGTGFALLAGLTGRGFLL